MEQREWHIKKTLENGSSYNVLVHQIESGLYERQAIAQKNSNFEILLPAPQSELAVQTMKDPYVFDFIPFKENIKSFKLIFLIHSFTPVILFAFIGRAEVA